MAVLHHVFKVPQIKGSGKGPLERMSCSLLCSAADRGFLFQHRWGWSWCLNWASCSCYLCQPRQVVNLPHCTYSVLSARQGESLGNNMPLALMQPMECLHTVECDVFLKWIKAMTQIILIIFRRQQPLLNILHPSTTFQRQSYLLYFCRNLSQLFHLIHPLLWVRRLQCPGQGCPDTLSNI